MIDAVRLSGEESEHEREEQGKKPNDVGPWRSSTMRALWRLDEATVHRSRALREALCGEALFILVK